MKECENCEIRKKFAKEFDVYWFDNEDCPMKCPFKLKPCPFCGKPARLVSYGFGISSYYATCSNEKCEVSPSTRYFSNEKEAITVWNDRPEDEDFIEHAKENNKEIYETMKRIEDKIEKLKMMVNNIHYPREENIVYKDDKKWLKAELQDNS